MKIFGSKTPTLRGAGQPHRPLLVNFIRSVSLTAERGKPYKRRGEVLVKILLVVITIGSGSFGVSRLSADKPVQYKIDWKSPEPAGLVDQTNILRGVIHPKPEGKSFWLFEQPSFSGVYPKEVPVKKNGEFEIRMPFGDANHSGCTFDVYGMVLPAGTHFREMDNMFHAPKGEKISQVTFTRR